MWIIKSSLLDVNASGAGFNGEDLFGHQNPRDNAGDDGQRGAQNSREEVSVGGSENAEQRDDYQPGDARDHVIGARSDA